MLSWRGDTGQGATGSLTLSPTILRPTRLSGKPSREGPRGNRCSLPLGDIFPQHWWTDRERIPAVRKFFSFLFPCACAFPRRPPPHWKEPVLESWRTDEEHGGVPRALWLVALGNPVFWVASFVLAHCTTHVLLGWPDGSLVWILTAVFEQAASFLLPYRNPAMWERYPPADARRRGEPVGFRAFERDLRTLCRQYFIPGAADLARVKKSPRKAPSMKWNATIGTPLGDVSSTLFTGGPRYLVGWPAFSHLLATLDEACGKSGRLYETCERCQKRKLAPYFTMVTLEMEHAQRTGTAHFPDRFCERWGQLCAALAPSVQACPKTAHVPSVSSTSGRSSVPHEAPSTGPTTRSQRRPIVVFEEEEVRTPLVEGAPSSVEEQLQEAQRELAELKRRQAEGAASAYTPLHGAGAAMFLPPTGPELSNLDNQLVIKAWLHNVQQFCNRMSIPESHRLGWAISGLKGAASTAWTALTYGVDLAHTTLEEMGDLLMKHFYQKHSMLSLWGRWAGLRQTASETGQEYADRVKELIGQEALPDHWAAAAFISGIREPVRARFYKTLQADSDRSFTLEQVSQLFVRFELTQSALRSTKTPTTGKRASDEANPPPPKKRAVQGASQCWICGGTKHPWQQCPKKKDTGCPSCGGSCASVRACPHSWYQTNKGATGGTRPSPAVSAQPSLREGRRLRSTARAAEVLDLTQDIKQVRSRSSSTVDTVDNQLTMGESLLWLLVPAGTRRFPLEALSERSLEGLGALQVALTASQCSSPVALPPLLSLSQRDMILPFSCKGQRGTALVDTGASNNFVTSQFLKLVNIETRGREKQYAVRTADGKIHQIHGYAVLDICVSNKWPVMRIIALPFSGTDNPLIFGAEWAQKLGLHIRWPGPVLCATSTVRKHRQVTDVTEVNGPSPAAQRLTNRLKEYANVFTPPGRIPAKVPFQHVIQIEDGTRPFRSPPYRMTAEQLVDLRNEIETYLDNEWVRPSQSPWGSPITYVPKKDNTRRLVFDYRRLNKATLPDASPLPRIDDLLATLARSHVYSKIDLKQGYNQIPMQEESIFLTAFVTPIPIRGANHFEWTVLPFGLMNAPPTFQRVMHHVMQGAEAFTAVYMDDILIHSPSKEEHVEHVTHVLKLLGEFRLHAKPSKCEWMLEEVEFLGYRLSHGRIQLTPMHVESIRQWAPPLRNRKEVQAFLGVAGFHRIFVKGFATIAKPLTDLTGNIPFVWTKEATESVETLQKALLSLPVLALWDVQAPTRVFTDASLVGIGAILQQFTQGEWHTVEFFSKKLKGAECNYSATDRELLAINEAVTKHWRHRLLDRQFELHTDHLPLCGELRYDSKHQEGRRLRWADRLQPFAIKFRHVAGTANQGADGLSRAPNFARLLQNSTGEPKHLNPDGYHASMACVRFLGSTDTSLERLWKQAIQRDPAYQQMLKDPPTGWESQSERLVRPGQQGQVTLIPKDYELRTALLVYTHDLPTAGHFGRTKTLSVLRQRWQWEGDATDVRDYVKSCAVCQMSKHLASKDPGYLIPIQVDEPWEILTLDFISGLPPDEDNKHTDCLVIVDKFTKWTIATPCRTNPTAEETAEAFLNNAVYVFGIPKVVISDRGTQFVSRMWKAILTKLGIDRRLATPRHAQSNGQTERTNGILKQRLTALCSDEPDQWAKALRAAVFAINTTPSESTGKSPFEALFARSPRLPVDVVSGANQKHGLDTHAAIWKQIRKNIQGATERMIKSANKRRRQCRYIVGNRVWLSTSAWNPQEGQPKLHYKYAGPFTIVERVNDNAYKLGNIPPGIHETQNITELRPYIESPTRFRTRPKPPIPKPLTIEGQEEWEIEEILATRIRANRREYKIRWKNSPGVTWEPRQNLTNCPQLLDRFEKRMGLKGPKPRVRKR